MDLPLQPLGGLVLLLLLAACGVESPSAPHDPEVRVVNAQVWRTGEVRLVSPDFATATALAVIVDSALVLDVLHPDTAAAWYASRAFRAGADTVVVRCMYCGVGTHALVVATDGGRTVALPFEVHGMRTSVLLQTAAVGRPLSLGFGSSQWWVGTSRGVSRFDASAGMDRPTLVDSTLDPGCLWGIGASADGAVVAADRGCGTLRARRYGAVTTEVDSGPPAAGWHWALNRPGGVWLLDSDDSVALAVRGAGGAWTWSRWAWPAGVKRGESGLVLSPDGRLAVASAVAGYPLRPAGALVFDLEHGTFLYRDSTVGAAVAFSPAGDTLASLVDTTLTLLDGRTGARLAAFALRRYGPYFPPTARSAMTWDPLRPWLYHYVSDGCSAMAVIDRRTWTLAGYDATWVSDVVGEGQCEGTIASSGFAASGWVMSTSQFSEHEWIVLDTFSIPDP